jgi:hypothetical protein
VTKVELFHFLVPHKLGVLGYLSVRGEPRSTFQPVGEELARCQKIYSRRGPMDLRGSAGPGTA